MATRAGGARLLGMALEHHERAVLVGVLDALEALTTELRQRAKQDGDAKLVQLTEHVRLASSGAVLVLGRGLEREGGPNPGA